jgi:voltage-gated potassium channel Kch
MDRKDLSRTLPSSADAEKSDYVLVCGFGRVGQAVCELLTSKLVRYKAFDIEPRPHL